jgi:lactose/L-arabinose transport system ATP-binding protein
MNFLAGRIAGSKAGAVTVELVNQGGARLTVPLKEAAPTDGSEITVGVRPEHFVDGGKGGCDLTLAVDVAEHLGSTSYVYAGTGSREPLIIEREESRHAGDENRLTVGIPVRRALLFSRDGKRLR